MQPSRKKRSTAKGRPAGRPVDEDKARDILESAHRLFLANGFEATTMESVALAAGVSKVTVYKRYKTKLTLFRESVHSAKCEMEKLLKDLSFGKMSLSAKLILYGVEFLNFVMRDEIIAFDRMLAQESVRYPALSREFFAAGPERCRTRLADLIATDVAWKASGKAHAQHMATTLLSLWLGFDWTAVRLNVRRPLRGRELRKHVESGVHLTLRAHATKHHG